MLLTLVSSISSKIHSWQPFNEPWGLPTAGPLPACQPVYVGDRGLFDRSSAFSTLEGLPFPLQCLHSSQEVIQILTFWLGIQLITALSTGSSHWAATQSAACRFTWIWVTLAWMTASWTCLFISVSFSHYWVVRIHPSCQSHSDSIHDGLHSFWTQPRLNPAECICDCIIPFLLVLDTKGESCKLFYPAVLGSIQIGCDYYISEQVVVSLDNEWLLPEQV